MATLNEDASSQLAKDSAGFFDRMFRALRHRNYRLFFFGQMISLLGTWIDQTAMGWLVYSISGSKLMLGGVAAAGTAPMLLFSVFGGSFADRYSKRKILIVTQLVAMSVALAIGTLVFFNWIRPWQILVLAAIGGVAMAFDMPARQSFVIEMTSREDLLNAISLNSSLFNGARVVGPSLAGLLISGVGMATCFFINGLSFIAVIAGLLMMRLDPLMAKPIEKSESVFEHALSGFRYVRNHPRVLTILALFAVVGIFGWSYSVLMPAIAKDELRLSVGGYGVLMSASSVGALAGALMMAARGQLASPRNWALGGIWIFSTGIILFSMCRSLPLAMPCLAVSGFGIMIFMSASNTTLQTIVSDEMRGRVMGIWALIFGGMIPIGSLEAGGLAHWIGSSETIVIGGVICALAAFVTLIVVKRRERFLAAQKSAAES